MQFSALSPENIFDAESPLSSYLPTPVFTPSEGGGLTVPSMGLLLRAGRYGQIDRLTLRPRGPGAVVEGCLQRCRERGRLRCDG